MLIACGCVLICRVQYNEPLIDASYVVLFTNPCVTLTRTSLSLWTVDCDPRLTSILVSRFMLDLQAVKHRSAGVTSLGGPDGLATGLRLEHICHTAPPTGDGAGRSALWEASTRCANLVKGSEDKGDVENLASSQDMDDIPRVPWQPVETGLGWMPSVVYGE